MKPVTSPKKIQPKDRPGHGFSYRVLGAELLGGAEHSPWEVGAGW